MPMPLPARSDLWYSLSEILHSVKRRSAREINRLRGRRGALWQDESFDRILRSDEEFAEKCNYVFNNAVQADLVSEGAEYDGVWWQEGW